MAINDTKARQWLEAGRSLISDRFPYLSEGFYFLVPHPMPGLGTLGVTEDAILAYDPALAESWTVGQIAIVLAHELFHHLRGHAERRRDAAADPELWNWAGDLEINDGLDVIVRADAKGARRVPLQWPPKSPPLLPSTFGFPENLLAEAYYDLLRQHKQQAQQGGGKQGQPQPGSQGKPKPGQQPGQPGPHQPSTCAGQCGGVAGNPVPGEPKSDGAGGGGGDEPKPGQDGEAAPMPKGRSAMESEVLREQIAREVIEAAKAQGTVPLGLVVWAQKRLRPPVVPWNMKVRRAVRQGVAFHAGAVLPTWKRFSRHQAGVGFGPGRPVLPALHAPHPRVMVALDTSGSMVGPALEAGLSEIVGVLKATGAAITFAACDAEVHVLQKVSKPAELVKLCKGGGGTDFRPIFREAVKLRPKPNLLIIVTDGMGSAPAHPPPGITVIWCIIGSPELKAPVSWGEVVRVPEKLGEAA